MELLGTKFGGRGRLKYAYVQRLQTSQAPVVSVTAIAGAGARRRRRRGRTAGDEVRRATSPAESTARRDRRPVRTTSSQDQLPQPGAGPLTTGYVCVYVIFIRCDKRTSNNKHKKQSQNDVAYSTKQQNQKTISLDKAI